MKTKSTLLFLVLLTLQGCNSQHAYDFAYGAMGTGISVGQRQYNRNGRNSYNHTPKAWEKGGYLNPYKTTIQTNDGTTFINESVDFLGNKHITVTDYGY